MFERLKITEKEAKIGQFKYTIVEHLLVRLVIGIARTLLAARLICTLQVRDSNL